MNIEIINNKIANIIKNASIFKKISDDMINFFNLNVFNELSNLYDDLENTKKKYHKH